MFRKMMYLFVGLLGATAIACSSPLPTSQDDAAPTTQMVGEIDAYSRGPGHGGSSSMHCLDTKLKVSLPVTPLGGVITNGTVTLVFPAGAVSKVTMITMEPVAGRMAVRFYPEGLQFPATARPKLTFNTICIGNPHNATIVYTDENGRILENKGGIWDQAYENLSARINHFSQYAVDW